MYAALAYGWGHCQHTHAGQRGATPGTMTTRTAMTTRRGMTTMSDLHVYDTTLRDGAQQEGLNLSVSDKLAIAAHLDELGVGFIEGGWPGANPKDTEFFARAATEQERGHDHRREEGDVGEAGRHARVQREPHAQCA